ncbi:MAG: DUF721 domain-containing protein [Candidatus Portnoybacteria bacterium]|nr:DUF721 domain-containing protein [Candidatus Portnoybacteria bacterium]
MWVTLKKILPFTINKLNLGPVLEFNQLALGWDKILVELFGEVYRNKTKPVSFKDKVLIVDCLNSIWASDLQLKQIRIIQHLNQLFGKELIEKMRFIS